MKHIQNWVLGILLMLAIDSSAVCTMSGQDEEQPMKAEKIAYEDKDALISEGTDVSDVDRLLDSEENYPAIASMHPAMSDKSKGFLMGLFSASLLFCLFVNRRKLLAVVSVSTKKTKKMENKSSKLGGSSVGEPRESSNALKEDTSNEQKVEAEAPNEQKVEAEAPNEQKAEAEAPNEQKAEAEAPNEQKVKAEAPNEQKAEAEAPNEQKAEAEAPNEQKVEAEAPNETHEMTATNAFAVSSEDWMVVGTSVIGKSHISMNLPCQDFNSYKYLGQGWGIAIVSDGAGSAKHSEIGSKLVATRGLLHFEELVEKEEWITMGKMPSDAEWTKKAYDTLLMVYKDMNAFAMKKNLPIKDLSATAMVFIHTPYGALCSHIGDGRMGYRTATGEWKSAMNPHKGEEANQTIFITSNFWNVPNFVMSDVLVPESIVIRECITGFTLMSDGCEHTMWLCNQKEESTGKYYDPNVPYAPLYNKLSATLVGMHTDADDPKECAESWNRFICRGNRSFINEPDDKTLLLGVLCSLKS